MIKKSVFHLGTKADLWNTVSPKMAQRVFSGMLNESLTILTSRFVHVCSINYTILQLIIIMMSPVIDKLLTINNLLLFYINVESNKNYSLFLIKET